MNSDIDELTIKNLHAVFDKELLKIAEKYFNDFECRSGQFYQYLKNNQFKEIAEIAHGLKGNSLNMGAKSLAEHCTELEKYAKIGQTEKLLVECDTLAHILPDIKKKYFSYITPP